jgi:hypothetical protein
LIFSEEIVLYLIISSAVDEYQMAVTRNNFMGVGFIFGFFFISVAAASLKSKLNSFARSLPIGIPIAIGGTILAAEAYSRIPQRLIFGSSPIPLLPFKEKDLVLIFHGAGGPDKNVQLLCEAVKESDRKQGIDRHVVSYDWSPWLGNLIRASNDAQCVGKIIGDQLAGCELKSLHVIGVSVGAFAADNCAYTLHKQMKKTKIDSKTAMPYIRLTLLDPFTQRGLFDGQYGLKLFGKSANYCEHVLNSDDPVPSTNTPISQGYVYDITSAEVRNRFTPLEGDNMHSWPVAYCGLNWKTEVNVDGTLYQPVHTESTARGAVMMVK